MPEVTSAAAYGPHGDLCAAFLQELPIDGAAVSIFGGSAAETLMCASDVTAARLDELQYDLGDGPRWDVFRTQLPVMIPDLSAAGVRLWPAFAEAAATTDAAALFVFPLLAGGLVIGVAELYCTSPREFSPAQISRATHIASRTAWTLLRGLMPDHETESAAIPVARREIHQATGMVLVQTGSTAAEALLLLRGHAFASGRSLQDTAVDVVNRRLNFTPAPDAADSGPQ
ncbi:GAF and ANTAR domain-containing protein [Arthrobacter sp. StoSoilB5]|uniref:GAF and ANTAR domain-containing protein n=1 Tax=Arthrobacter sp. StoSoilB5 TaxID=2830992 RepID=UPI001CC7CCB0|nr:GAF and ANTAR domain-containing protein [Arthrobacter sp. StoSoilB5]BCW45325.1 GAF domain-containing protein [Arthrobacter sp. StoSoilB5]